jgi:hypothetical protein
LDLLAPLKSLEEMFCSFMISGSDAKHSLKSELVANVCSISAVCNAPTSFNLFSQDNGSVNGGGFLFPGSNLSLSSIVGNNTKKRSKEITELAKVVPSAKLAKREAMSDKDGTDKAKKESNNAGPIIEDNMTADEAPFPINDKLTTERIFALKDKQESEAPLPIDDKMTTERIFALKDEQESNKVGSTIAGKMAADAHDDSPFSAKLVKLARREDMSEEDATDRSNLKGFEFGGKQKR